MTARSSSSARTGRSRRPNHPTIVRWRAGIIRFRHRLNEGLTAAFPEDDPTLLVEAQKSPVGRVVDLGQAVVDLYTSPGRGREEAEQLMNALARRDASWA